MATTSTPSQGTEAPWSSRAADWVCDTDPTITTSPYLLLWTALDFPSITYRSLEIPQICYTTASRRAVGPTGSAGKGKDKSISFSSTCLACTFCLIPHDHSSSLFTLHPQYPSVEGRRYRICFHIFFCHHKRASEQAIGVTSYGAGALQPFHQGTLSIGKHYLCIALGPEFQITRRFLFDLALNSNPNGPTRWLFFLFLLLGWLRMTNGLEWTKT